MQRRNWPAVLAVLATATTFALAACGSDDEDDGDDFVSEADAVCIDQASQLRDLALEREGPPLDAKTAAAAYEENVPVLEQSQADLEAIEPPSDQSDNWDEYLSLRQERIDMSQQVIDAVASGDTEAADEIAPKISPIVDEYEGIAEEMGLQACAAILPEDQVAAVEAAEQDAAASEDPEFYCEEFLLPQARRLQFGTDDPQKCIDEPNSGEALSVEVSDVTGVDGVSASATVEFPDAEKNLQGPFEDDLYYLDGAWKLYASFQPG